MADDDFSTGAELEISVSDSSLSEARDTIESELGDLEVDVNAVVSGNRQQPRDPSSGQFMGIEGVEQRVVNTNDTLDSLIQIEQDRWELDKYRNDYLEQLAEGGRVLQRGGQQGGGGGGTTIIGGTGALSKIGGGLGVGAVGATAGIVGGSVLGGIGALSLISQSLSDKKKQQLGRQQQRINQQAAAGKFDVMRSGFGASNGAPQQAPEWPELPNLSQELEWPTLPDLSQEFQWPEPPDFGNLFGGGDGDPSMNRSREGLRRFGPNESAQQNVEPTINLGGITVDVTTTIDNAVDDAVTEVEDTVEDEVAELERRVADAIGGFF